MEVGILRTSSSALHYLRGSCSWQVNIPSLNFTREVEFDSQILLSDDTAGHFFKCIVNKTVELQTVIRVYGELHSTLQMCMG